MSKLTAQQFADKWGRRLSAATPDIQAGIQRVDQAPGEAAVAKQDKMRANFNAALDSGKWATNTRRVTLADWKSAAINKGIPRISQGVAGASVKVQNFANQLLPYQDSLKAQISSMPDLTLEDNIARMTAFTRGMAKFKPS